MIFKFTLACVIIFGILSFLKFVDDSPIRSWKSVFFTGIPLSFIVCYWVNCAYPPPPPLAPPNEKVSAYRAELERTFRRIEGVTSASIKGSIAEINFGKEMPPEKLRQIAHHCGGAAAYFFRSGDFKGLVIFLKVMGNDRYRIEYGPDGNIISEGTP